MYSFTLSRCVTKKPSQWAVPTSVLSQRRPRPRGSLRLSKWQSMAGNAGGVNNINVNGYQLFLTSTGKVHVVAV